MKCIDGSWDYIAICKPGGKSNVTIGINDVVKIYITSNHYNMPNIEIDTDNSNNITVDSNVNLNVQITPNVNGYNINILSKNNNTHNVPTDSISDTKNFSTGSSTQNVPVGCNKNTQNSSMVSNNNTTKSPTDNNNNTAKYPTDNNNTKDSNTGSGSNTNVNVKTSTEDPSAYDIGDENWRIGQVSPIKPKDKLTTVDDINDIIGNINSRIVFLD